MENETTPVLPPVSTSPSPRSGDASGGAGEVVVAIAERQQHTPPPTFLWLTDLLFDMEDDWFAEDLADEIYLNYRWLHGDGSSVQPSTTCSSVSAETTLAGNHAKNFPMLDEYYYWEALDAAGNVNSFRSLLPRFTCIMPEVRLLTGSEGVGDKKNGKIRTQASRMTETPWDLTDPKTRMLEIKRYWT